MLKISTYVTYIHNNAISGLLGGLPLVLTTLKIVATGYIFMTIQRNRYFGH